ncbi:S16 family serine protease [Paenibacillus sp. NPDC058071]|uniref:S16 family serine protease n=1 Tax=Paenibacillus sp. NPDC058071 TaxID=3346326 RepID=UPI0036DCAABA
MARWSESRNGAGIGKRTLTTAAATALVMWLLLYAPSPFVLYEPGTAEPTYTMVKAEDAAPGQGDNLTAGSGQFLMTTVKLSETNFWGAVSSSWKSNTEAATRRSVLKGSTEKQYADRMAVVMQGSQNNAVEAAYRYAQIPYKIAPDGLAVSDARNKSETKLMTGDRITGVKEASSVYDTAELIQALQGKKTGDDIELSVIRNDKAIQLPIVLSPFDGEIDKHSLLQALGVNGLVEFRRLQPNDNVMSLTIDAGEVGGPSAGLMFALQSLDLLTPGDLTKGFRIAGTGTITPEGEVGPVGGIGYKVVAADAAGAQLFLAPASNYAEAAQKAKEEGSSMRVISVSSLQGALDAIASQSTRS